MDNFIYNEDEFIQLQFDPITEIILFSQENKEIIRREFRKLKKFYIAHPEVFYYHLDSSKDSLQNKSDLTEREEITLNEVNNLLKKNKDIKKLFKIRAEYILDDLRKIYMQLDEMIKTPPHEEAVFEIIFYSLDMKRRKKIPLCEHYEDGTLNTGSRLRLDMFKINALQFLFHYKAHCN